ncbi:formiminotetrahydrofolate cyclodeaminase [Enterococcus sp. AZ194]|uniref:cyclodeaminase/cyclohydrolase family protein n=1 Tax=Enterococcus sp. AZ194 TaxID=2774629 RepID=UPI003F26CFB5
MKLVDMKVAEFVSVLASDAPAPGGGSAAALAGSIGSALTIMVMNLTIGKKKYETYDSQSKEILQEMTKLNEQLVAIIDKDTEAFDGVSAIFSMPKETDEEKEKRRMAMQAALKAATLVPFEMMELMTKAAKVTQNAVGKSNINAASDLGVAALNLNSGLKGAWLNVLINLSGVKDQEFVEHYKQEGKKVLEEGCRVTDEIYAEILKIV